MVDADTEGIRTGLCAGDSVESEKLSVTPVVPDDGLWVWRGATVVWLRYWCSTLVPVDEPFPLSVEE